MKPTRIVVTPSLEQADGVIRQDMKLEGEPYDGVSCCLIPIVVNAATEEEASAIMDAATADVVKALKAHPRTKLATDISDAPAVITACRMVEAAYTAGLQAYRARQARDN